MIEIYELAFKLHMPVYRLLTEMPYEELLGWFEYFRQRPSGWQEDQRTYMLLQAQGVKEKPEKLFSSIAAIKSAAEERDDKLSSSIVNSGLFARLKNAAAKNKVDWEVEVDKT
jgi:hypothetical protein